eukprot:TRINITY_DN10882_c0_g2_i4.p1 TRINITY_DN10882_c0_g2~~TRINITY_DN10882_c0_g2_i4.p1  ORF type:complete len:270 (-),score=48.93 TRINITY_DN10882_c0_g2_i4:61-870(-)
MPVAMVDDIARANYDEIGGHYNKAVFYDVEGAYVQWQVEQVSRKLELSPGTNIIDIGAGTGGFTHQLVKKLVAMGDLEPSVVAVEPSGSMLAQARVLPEPRPSLMQADIKEIISSDIKCDVILLKEVVHHFPLEDRPAIASGLFDMLLPNGRVLIVTRPAKLVDYPFPEFFLEYWEKNQPNPELYEMLLRDAGFEVVSEAPEKFPLRLSKTCWHEMLRNRFWSWLAHFSDDEIDKGIEELKSRFPGDDEDYMFSEQLIFIVGKKVVAAK